jgi:hypothetical protein
MIPGAGSRNGCTTATRRSVSDRINSEKGQDGDCSLRSACQPVLICEELHGGRCCFVLCRPDWMLDLPGRCWNSPMPASGLRRLIIGRRCSGWSAGLPHRRVWSPAVCGLWLVPERFLCIYAYTDLASIPFSSRGNHSRCGKGKAQPARDDSVWMGADGTEASTLRFNCCFHSRSAPENVQLAESGKALAGTSRWWEAWDLLREPRPLTADQCRLPPPPMQFHQLVQLPVNSACSPPVPMEKDLHASLCT